MKRHNELALEQLPEIIDLITVGLDGMPTVIMVRI